MKLTERKIETLPIEHGRKDRLIFDDHQRGLAVRVTASGSRTYLCQYTLHGQKWRVPLGTCSALSLSNARAAAAAIMGDVAKGRNPAAERKESAAAERVKRARDRLTLRMLIEDWNRLRLSGRRPRYATEAVRALHYALAHHLDSAAEDLDRAAVALSDRQVRKGIGVHRAAFDGPSESCAPIGGRAPGHGGPSGQARAGSVLARPAPCKGIESTHDCQARASVGRR